MFRKPVRKEGWNLKSWPENEVEVLHKLYPSEITSDVLKALPNRNWTAIKHKASRIGITREDHYWKQTEERTCPWCGKSFLSKRSMKWQWTRFCSEECRYRFYQHNKHGLYSRVTKICPFCSRFFVTTKPKLQRFCSRKCGYEYNIHKILQWGRDHPQEKKLRDRLHYLKCRQSYQKSSWKLYGTSNHERKGVCEIQKCNKQSRAVHHLIPRWLTHDDDSNNLIEVCTGHHTKLDQFVKELLAGNIDYRIK